MSILLEKSQLTAKELLKFMETKDIKICGAIY